ncbi:rhomboid family intramembrane serine protease [Aureivirga sp. CE67]|uniref:rhomboid family intramembrane serine protease n=1 Tax=Aureivirga sp. CE67 TaxID=1788983 RepID=UPI0018C90E13|nr:rhomboid family intramembrane serine protease [Aureivirga sp. CE67]
MNLVEDIKHAYHKASVNEKIIYINILFFVFSLLFQSFFQNWVALPVSFSEFLKKPWTAISYGFVHFRFFHILSILLVLYYFGNLFLDFFTPKKFLNYYFLGLLSGAAFFLGFYAINPNHVIMPLGGASAAVSAILIGITTKIPQYSFHIRFIGPVKILFIALVWVGLNLVQLGTPDAGAAIAHLGGAILGFVYTKALNNNIDIGKWFEVSMQTIFSFGRNLKKPKSHLKTVHKSTKKASNKSVPKSYSPRERQNKIDAILDKISKSGYDSLSSEEKEFLFNEGKK